MVQTIGAGTERMMALNEGDALEDFVGPLGCPSELCEEENLEETRKKENCIYRRRSGNRTGIPTGKMVA